MEQNEFNIPVPWGHIAVKSWGNSKNTPILVVHGVMDNAGSFDRLIPLLPNNFYYICIELPGHGKSSQYPPNLPIYTMNNVIVYKLVLDHLNRGKYIILGHSWGGQIGIFFTQLYPEYVSKLIVLDSIYLWPITDNYKHSVLDTISQFIDFKNKTPAVYTYEEALRKAQEKRRYGKLNTEATKSLLKRGLNQVEEGKYIFNVDFRTKFFVNPEFTIEFAIQFMRQHPVTCPILLVIASHSVLLLSYFEDLLVVMRENPKFYLQVVRGNHDVHNNSPELVAPFVSEFLVTDKITVVEKSKL